MPPRRDGIKHARVVPCADVAACGERGEHLRFSMAIKWVTCRMCKVRRQQSIDRKRVAGNKRIIGNGWGT